VHTGVIPFNWFIALSQFKDKPFALGARLIYKIPGLREVFSTWSIEGSKENFEKLVASGRSTCCLMGGVPEMILSEPGLKIKVFCKNNGFVRLALQNGTDLVPVFAFGENNQWTQRRAPAFVSNFVSKWTGGTYPFFPSGSSWWTLVPHETKVVYVVGEIVKVSRDARNPTEQEIDATHLRFYTQMQQMILRKRKEAGFSNVFVEFVGLEHLNVRPESPELKSFI
jgi:2-acylglycerol O-acyltransferase 2